MAPNNTDAWLWVTLGKTAVKLKFHQPNRFSAFVSYYAALTIHKQLENTRFAAEITKEEKPSDMVSKRTENGKIASVQFKERTEAYQQSSSKPSVN